MDLPKMIRQNVALLVDVREPFEYADGHAAQAINIPVDSIPGKIEAFKNSDRPIVVYCKSGIRSARATGFLRALGIPSVYNGGSLAEIQQYQAEG